MKYFFADKVICIEGDTERILMPMMMHKLDKEIEKDITKEGRRKRFVVTFAITKYFYY